MSFNNETQDQKGAQFKRKVRQDKGGEKKDKKLKPVTEAYLERAALYYLERYTSSSKNLMRVLDRKIRRRKESFESPSEEEKGWIKNVVRRCAELGYVDDGRYAGQKALSMHMAGKSERAIREYLVQKGVGGRDISDALDAVTEERGDDSALKAAIIYARKRGFGPFRMRAAAEDRVQKDIMAMLRAGHQMDHIQKIMKADSVSILEDILYAP